RITYIDNQVFDNRLSDSMRRRTPEILVSTTDKVAVNELPPNLEKWLAAVDKSGGGVTFVNTEQAVTGDSRSLLAVAGIVFAILEKTWAILQERQLYAPAADYKATVYYRQSDRLVDRVAFLHK